MAVRKRVLRPKDYAVVKIKESNNIDRDWWNTICYVSARDMDNPDYGRVRVYPVNKNRGMDHRTSKNDLILLVNRFNNISVIKEIYEHTRG